MPGRVATLKGESAIAVFEIRGVPVPQLGRSERVCRPITRLNSPRQTSGNRAQPHTPKALHRPEVSVKPRVSSASLVFCVVQNWLRPP